MKLGQTCHYTTQEGECVSAIVTSVNKDGTLSVAAFHHGATTEFHSVPVVNSPVKETYEERNPVTQQKVTRVYQGFPGHSAHPLDAHDNSVTLAEPEGA